MKYISAQDILVIHSEIIDATGGFHGVRDVGLLESIAEGPKQRFGGKELYKGTFTKAALYLQTLAQYHVFVDGNKRTAAAATARFLFLNGYELHATNKALEKFALKVARANIDLEPIAHWMKNHSHKLTPYL